MIFIINVVYRMETVNAQHLLLTTSLLCKIRRGIWGANESYAGFRLACRYAAWSSLAVSELQLSAATPLWLYHWAASLPSWIEFNCLRSAVVGKAARLSIYWLDAACSLVIPLRQVALAQLNKYHHQSGNVASGKLVWNQHKFASKMRLPSAVKIFLLWRDFIMAWTGC